MTMSPFWNCPGRWNHDSGGWRRAFCLATGTYIAFRLGMGGGGARKGSIFCSFVCVCFCFVRVLVWQARWCWRIGSMWRRGGGF